MTQVHSDVDALAVPRPVLSGLSRFNKQELIRLGYGFFNRAYDFGERKYHRALGHAAAVTREGPVGGLCGVMAQLPFTAEEVLRGYAQGMFPMEKRGQVYWHSPDPRCVIPLERLHVPSRVARYLRSGMYELAFDRNPAAVLAACADRTETWLSPRLQQAYLDLFELGALHTVEAYAGERLVGGAFGVALGSVFTIESMFSHENHASKLAFAHLCQHLVEWGFKLADCQYLSPHVERFGAIEMPRDEYRNRMALGLIRPATFQAPRDERRSDERRSGAARRLDG